MSLIQTMNSIIDGNNDMNIEEIIKHYFLT